MLIGSSSIALQFHINAELPLFRMLFTRSKRQPLLSRALSNVGLTGEGQIVAVADSGVDTASCFFHDPGDTHTHAKHTHAQHTFIHTCTHTPARLLAHPQTWWWLWTE